MADSKKSVILEELLQTLEEWLHPALLNDYCPNGLQVEGTPLVSRVVSGVTACEALIDRAIACGADALLVHHGYFWKGEAAVVTGMKKRRLAKLLAHDISLLAYHLPLDVHLKFGNNAGLASRLELSVEGQISAGGTENLLWYGCLPQSMSESELAVFVESRLNRKPLIVTPCSHQTANQKYRTIAWCTGGAQGYIDNAAALGVDVYLSGEISEQTVHSARELGICYVAVGHHASERYGVQLLGQALANKFGIDVRFEDVSNPA
jgi:dinuclear metal center YbgI/SA1388 family protein